MEIIIVVGVGNHGGVGMDLRKCGVTLTFPQEERFLSCQ